MFSQCVSECFRRFRMFSECFREADARCNLIVLAKRMPAAIAPASSYGKAATRYSISLAKRMSAVWQSGRPAIFPILFGDTSTRHTQRLSGRTSRPPEPPSPQDDESIARPIPSSRLVIVFLCGLARSYMWSCGVLLNVRFFAKIKKSIAYICSPAKPQS